jgi:sugar/nucleoside kinase (ribokinase family)
MTNSGLFVGMVTLDLIYRVDHFPKQNEKIAAKDCAIAAGGPATNAAVAFSALGSRAMLLGAIGTHAYSNLIRADLAAQQVNPIDLAADPSALPPISSIIVTQSTGDRAVVSLNGTHLTVLAQHLPPDILHEIDIILCDGHQLELSRAIAKRSRNEIAPQAKAKPIPIVLDGGSWKPGLEKILPFVDYALCSADFYPPHCTSQAEVFADLVQRGIPHIAITQGEKPIQYLTRGTSGQVEVSQIQPVDTLGAGDIFHGAFCHYILQHDFIEALARAARIATFSCQFFGTRTWRDRDFLKTLT